MTAELKIEQQRGRSGNNRPTDIMHWFHVRETPARRPIETPLLMIQ